MELFANASPLKQKNQSGIFGDTSLAGIKCQINLCEEEISVCFAFEITDVAASSALRSLFHYLTLPLCHARATDIDILTTCVCRYSLLRARTLHLCTTTEIVRVTRAAAVVVAAAVVAVPSNHHTNN